MRREQRKTVFKCSFTTVVPQTLTSRDVENSRRLRFCAYLYAATKYSSLDSRSYSLAQPVGAASAANAETGNSEQNIA